MVQHIYYLLVLRVVFSLQRWLWLSQTDDLKQQQCCLQSSVDLTLDLKVVAFGRILPGLVIQIIASAFPGVQMASIHLLLHMTFSYLSHHSTSLSAFHWSLLKSRMVLSWEPWVIHSCKDPNSKHYLILRFQLDVSVGGDNQTRTGEFNFFSVPSYCLS